MSRIARKRNAGPVTVTVTGLSHEGRGIARVDDKAVFVDGAFTSDGIFAPPPAWRTFAAEASRTACACGASPSARVSASTSAATRSRCRRQNANAT
jgi:tRNA/tmRNA/rRNA uracil-C5-methylase (TrmA/RlmC/RlmD family)